MRKAKLTVTDKPIDPRGWVVVKKVRNGRGLVATRSFRAGEFVMDIVGKVITADEVWGYWEVDEQLATNCYRYGADHYLNPIGHISMFANHSCSPNSGIIKRGSKLMLQSIAPIAPGEEITHDYSTLIAADDVWTMRCNCGEENCRKTVRNINKLPVATRARYGKLGIVPRFILSVV